MAVVFTPGEPVKINIQSIDPNLPNRAFNGAIEDVRKKQLLLLSDEEVRDASSLTARTQHILYMGRVRHSSARVDGKWDVEVVVDRTLAMM